MKNTSCTYNLFSVLAFVCCGQNNKASRECQGNEKEGEWDVKVINRILKFADFNKLSTAIAKKPGAARKTFEDIFFEFTSTWSELRTQHRQKQFTDKNRQRIELDFRSLLNGMEPLAHELHKSGYRLVDMASRGSTLYTLGSKKAGGQGITRGKGRAKMNKAIEANEEEKDKQLGEIIKRVLDEFGKAESTEIAVRQEFHNAIKVDDTVKVIEILKEKNIDINDRDKKHRTPLHYAIKKNSQKVVRALLKQEDIDSKILIGSDETFLHYAVVSELYRMVELVLDVPREKRIDINSTNGVGLTPLDIAQKIENPEIIEILVDKGAQAGKSEQGTKEAYFKALQICSLHEKYGLPAPSFTGKVVGSHVGLANIDGCSCFINAALQVLYTVLEERIDELSDNALSRMLKFMKASSDKVYLKTEELEKPMHDLIAELNKNLLDDEPLGRRSGGPCFDVILPSIKFDPTLKGLFALSLAASSPNELTGPVKYILPDFYKNTFLVQSDMWHKETYSVLENLDKMHKTPNGQIASQNLPEFLGLRLMTNMYGKALNIEFPFEFDIQEEWCKSDTLKRNINKDRVHYELVACIGDFAKAQGFDGEHCYAICRVGDDDRWIQYNEYEVVEIKDFKEYCENYFFHPQNTYHPAPLVLLYKKKS